MARGSPRRTVPTEDATGSRAARNASCRAAVSSSVMSFSLLLRVSASLVYGAFVVASYDSRSYDAPYVGFSPSTAFHRVQFRKVGVFTRRGICSLSYQSLYSSSGTPGPGSEKTSRNAVGAMMRRVWVVRAHLLSRYISSPIGRREAPLSLADYVSLVIWPSSGCYGSTRDGRWLYGE